MTIAGSGAVVREVYFPPSPPNVAIDMSIPENRRAAGIEESQWRADELNKKFVDGQLVMKLPSQPEILFFDKGYVRNRIADGVRDQLLVLKPELASDPWMKKNEKGEYVNQGVKVKIKEVALRDDPADGNRAFVVAIGQIADLASTESFKKSDLMSGRPIEVIFTPVNIPVQQDGNFSVGSTWWVQYNDVNHRFDVLKGKAEMGLRIPDKVNEHQPLPVPAFSTERLP